MGCLGVVISLTGCGGGGGGGAPAPAPNPNLPEGSVTGRIMTPNGETPIAGATVSIPDSVPIRQISTMNINWTLPCEAPVGAYVVATCTDANGQFSLDISQIATVTFPVEIKKGSFSHAINVDLAGASSLNLGGVSLTTNNVKFAVVTGSFDRMEDILAKLGMGTLDGDNRLALGSEKFDLYDGLYDLDADYPEFMALFDMDSITGQARIYAYDMVFINCGNAYENEVLIDPNVRALIRAYVNQGGKLYITDLAYNFVEQVFPEYIDFYGGDDVAVTEPERTNEAGVGYENIRSDATVMDNQLATWLDNISCQGSPCRNQDGTVHVQGFLGGWGVMNGIHPGMSGSTKVWIQGPVSWVGWGGDEEGVKPLTMSFNHGAGKVLYTSYHTENESPSSSFWPQERILQYLVFEL